MAPIDNIDRSTPHTPDRLQQPGIENPIVL